MENYQRKLHGFSLMTLVVVLMAVSVCTQSDGSVLSTGLLSSI